MKGLICNGELVPADVDVVDGREQGLWWEPGDPGTRREPHTGQLFVWHFQAGLGDAKQVHRVLRRRRLAVPLQINLEGVLTQMADMSTRCAHAGRANDLGGGVEIASYGLATKWRRMKAILRRRGYPAERYEDDVHGRRMDYFRLLPAQLHTALRLYLALIEIGIPARWPMDEVEGRVVRGVLPDLQRWRGHVAHYHITRNKVGVDPATCDQLAARACLAPS